MPLLCFTILSTSDNVAWIEKFRPSTFSEIVGQEENVKVLQTMCKTVSLEDFPHLLFYGKAGVGKTTMAYVIARELGLYNPEEQIFDIYEFNTSLDRGIGVVRDKFVDLAKIIPMNNSRKIIFLDEFDNMTSDAQEALRRVMEIYSRKTIFIMSVNDIDAVIDPIKSRCIPVEFGPLKPNELFTIAEIVLKKEERFTSPEQLEELRKLANNYDSARDYLEAMLWVLCGGKFETGFKIEEYIEAVKHSKPYTYEYTTSFQKIVEKVVEYLNKKGVEERRKLIIRILDPIMLNPYYKQIEKIAKEWLRYQLQQHIELL